MRSTLRLRGVRRDARGASPRWRTPGSTRGAMPVRAVALPVREPGGVRSAPSRPTTSARRSTRRAAGSTRCTPRRRCSRRRGRARGIAFKNVICLGHILDEKGNKMSKSQRQRRSTRGPCSTPAAPTRRAGTCTPPARRLIRAASAGRWSEEGLRQLPAHALEHVQLLRHLRQHRWLDAARRRRAGRAQPAAIDRWVLARLNALVREVTDELEATTSTDAARKAIERFVDDLSNWYVRRNRRRFWEARATTPTSRRLRTLYTCLTTLARLLAPFTPFVSEALYQNLVAEQRAGAPASVHLAPLARRGRGADRRAAAGGYRAAADAVEPGSSGAQGANCACASRWASCCVRAPPGGEGAAPL